MRASRERILTSHAGSLPRPDDLIDANRAREAGGAADEAGFQTRLRAGVADVVRRQKEVGDPISSLLGELARPAHDRHPDARHRERHARRQRRRLLLRGR